MEIKLTPEESENLFHTALCNAVGTNYMDGYGIEMTPDKEQYNQARDNWYKVNPSVEACYEDILLQILKDGNKLTFTDHEGEGENTRSISLQDVHERVQKTPLHNLTNLINEEDDVNDADALLQTVFFEDIIFG
jgi:hypothetical protein